MFTLLTQKKRRAWKTSKASSTTRLTNREQASMAGKIEIMETVLRDAHQCLVATRMRTEDMLPIAADEPVITITGLTMSFEHSSSGRTPMASTYFVSSMP